MDGKYKIDSYLSATVHGTGRSDFGNTSFFNFELPDGVSFVSSSGVLLSNPYSPITSGAVPEPTTWALMIAGFGMIGAAMRRRRTRVRVRYA